MVWTWLAAFASSEHRLPEGVLRTDLLSTTLEVRPGKHRDIQQLVPLVPEGWTEAEPVRAWVRCDPHRQLCIEPSAWLEALEPGQSAGEVVPGLGVAGWDQALLDAEKRHGLTSAPDAAVFHAGEPQPIVYEEPGSPRKLVGGAMILGGLAAMASGPLPLLLNLVMMLWGGKSYKEVSLRVRRAARLLRGDPRGAHGPRRAAGAGHGWRVPAVACHAAGQGVVKT